MKVVVFGFVFRFVIYFVIYRYMVFGGISIIKGDEVDIFDYFMMFFRLKVFN